MGRRKKNRVRTRVFVVQDSSGSMSSRRAETISGFNEYVGTLKKDAEGDILLSLIQFDTRVNDVFINRDLQEVYDLSDDDFVPGGMTALRDGVGRAIKTAEASSGKDDHVIFVVMTDGGENSSTEYTHTAILDQIKDKRKKGWEFVFLGAGEEAWSAGQSLGFESGKSIFYGNDGHDHALAFRSVAKSTANYSVGAVAMAASGNVGATVMDFSIDAEDKALLEEKAKKELV
jgi:Mg-chelatase subunit ChlD